MFDLRGANAYRAALGILGDAAAAEATVEEAFREVTRSADRGVTTAAGAAAVEAAAHRLATDAQARPDAIRSAPSGTVTPAALLSLRPGPRAAFELAVFEGLKVGAIAERMQLAPHVVTRLLNDALRSCRIAAAPSATTALGEWRETLRRWEGLPLGHPERHALSVEVAHAWLEYQVASGAVRPHELVMISDRDRRYVTVTANAATTLGRPSLVGLRIDDITAEPNRLALPQVWQTFLARGSMEGEYDCERPGTTPIRLQFRAFAGRPLPAFQVSYLVPMA